MIYYVYFALLTVMRRSQSATATVKIAATKWVQNPVKYSIKHIFNT